MQLRFYVALTTRLDAVLGSQASITLGSLLARIRPVETDFGGLAEQIRKSATC
ncbi:hypothetical protein [Tomitella gaofuii]|uniref:hypothetical protein n=1 Tax=Tomitella gaofuii TaxID=2760083 RepID=UPI0015F7FBFC|nr:hypothetical protein [Tomitella gaofuii]